jgi:sortase A
VGRNDDDLVGRLEQFRAEQRAERAARRAERKAAGGVAVPTPAPPADAPGSSAAAASLPTAPVPREAVPPAVPPTAPAVPAAVPPVVSPTASAVPAAVPPIVPAPAEVSAAVRTPPPEAATVLRSADASAVRRANRMAAAAAEDAAATSGDEPPAAAGSELDAEVVGTRKGRRDSAATDAKYRSWFEELSAKQPAAAADQESDLVGVQPADARFAARRRLDDRLVDGQAVDDDLVNGDPVEPDPGPLESATLNVRPVRKPVPADLDLPADDDELAADDPRRGELVAAGDGFAPDSVIERVRTVVRGVGQTLISCGVVILLFVAYELWITDLFNKHTQDQLASQLSQTWGQGEDPLDQATVGAPGEPGAKVRSIPLGTGLAYIRIPRLGLDYVRVIVEGTSEASLAEGPGHYVNSALPGQQGNFAVAGHRVGKGSPFLDLDKLRAGDPVVIETKSSYYIYRVLGDRKSGNPAVDDPKTGVPGQEVVDPTDVGVITPTPDHPGATASGHFLTLTTCHPKFSARQRMIIHAVQDGAAWPKSKGLPPVLKG